jgi:hypothetical protein
LSKLSRSAIRELVYAALVARVGLLLGQAGFDRLLAEQERVSTALARGARLAYGPGEAGYAAMAEAVLDAFELDPVYYAASDLDFIVSEGLTSAGLALADAVRGHESDDRKTWQGQVVPRLDRVAEFVVSVFDGRWPEQYQGKSLNVWLLEQA